MNETLSATQSLWMQAEEIPTGRSLQTYTSADVCVVGAGIAGLSTAYLLLREGRSVVILDSGSIGSGQTQRTTAHLSNAIDDRYVHIEAWHGQEGARLAAESHTAAIERMEAIITRENIACDFERLDGYLFAPPGESAEFLPLELQAARQAGLTSVELVPRAPLSGFETGPCLRFPNQAQFHPLKYLAGLKTAVLGMGGRIFTQTQVEQIESGPPARIRTREGYAVTAATVVVATNSPFNDRLAIHTKQAAYMTYVVGFAVPHGSVTKALYWDTHNPYHYVRLQSIPTDGLPGERLGDPETEVMLLIGGEDHKTGQADDAEERYNRLEAWARERFPITGSRRCQWSGQVLETMDGLAFIGRNPLDGPNVFIATGDSGQGMTHGTIAGMLITDLVVGKQNPWVSLYEPSRKTLRAAGKFLEENVNVARQYGSWLTGGDLASTDEIAAGKGAVVRRGMTKVAAYRDEAGALHECSAICPHLGCIVEWNQNESSWDCPCHGSRFDKQGKVLCSPANQPLAPSRES